MYVQQTKIQTLVLSSFQQQQRYQIFSFVPLKTNADKSKMSLKNKLE